MENLKQILKQIKEHEAKADYKYEEIFYAIAKNLMNQCQLKIKDTFFEFTEIEFYYFHKDYHPDCNVHQHKYQQESSIYFHDKDGFGGVDIGFGDEMCYGGILIRGIKNCDNNTFINGPIRVADEITSVYYSEENPTQKIKNLNYKKLVDKNLLDDKFLDIEKKEQQDKSVYCAPRFGLVKDNDYLIKNYRFIKYFQPEHKFQEKSLVYLASKNMLDNITGYKKEIILKGLNDKVTRASKLYEKYK